jgi:hypothetical protein
MFNVVIACINHGFLYTEKGYKSHVKLFLIWLIVYNIFTKILLYLMLNIYREFEEWIVFSFSFFRKALDKNKIQVGSSF